MERPDLSYPAEFEQRAFPAALVTLVRAQPGKQEACEELIRKVAEAIPKLGEPAQHPHPPDADRRSAAVLDGAPSRRHEPAR